MRFERLAAFFERLEATAKRLEMFDLLAELFRLPPADEIDKVVYLCQGELLPSFRGVDLGLSDKSLVRVFAAATGQERAAVERHYRESGDLGETAAALLARAGGARGGLTVAQVYDGLMALAGMSGEGSMERKQARLGALFAAATPIEAKYLARLVTGRLRLGAGDATVLEALALTITGVGGASAAEAPSGPPAPATGVGGASVAGAPSGPPAPPAAAAAAKARREVRVELERAYNLCSDLGRVARALFAHGLEGVRAIGVEVGYPIRMARCERVSGPEEIIERVGRCAVEAKYDGFRCQVHVDRGRVEIFSRNLERTTDMFPEIVAASARLFPGRSAVFEGEALAVNDATGEPQPFQVTIQRKRKHGVAEMAREIPLRFFAFDLLYLDGQDLTVQPLEHRRALLEAALPRGGALDLSEYFVTDDAGAIQRFFDDAIARGLEGIIAKRLDAPYAAGARNFNWIKLKRSYKGELSDAVDLVIVGYFAGRGSRARFGIGGVLAAVYDPDGAGFKTVSRIGSGFSEDDLARLKPMLDEIALAHPDPRVESLVAPDVWTRPQLVITVTADEITRSPQHTAGRVADANGVMQPGYALRFPRMVGFVRADKGPEEATTVDEIRRLYELQRRVTLAES